MEYLEMPFAKPQKLTNHANACMQATKSYSIDKILKTKKEK